MSKKPSGEDGKIKRKPSVYVARVKKPNKAQRRQQLWLAQSKTAGGKPMHVARGTERARRRAGLHRGWRISGAGPKMQPAVIVDAQRVNLLLSTSSLTLSFETMASRAAAAKLKAKQAAKVRGVK